MAYDPINDYIDPAMHQASIDAANLYNIIEYNNAQSRAAAWEARDWNYHMANIANDFNAAQAQVQRDWQQKMSNTAHQREVVDLIKAGLNPVLSANNGATVPSGAAASSHAASTTPADLDQSGTSSLAGLFSTIVQADASIKNTNVTAMTQSNIAEQQRALSMILNDANIATQKAITAANNTNSRYLGELSAEVALRNAQVTADASRDAAYASASAMRYSAQQSAAASKYAADMSYQNARDNPTTLYGTLNRAANELMDKYLAGVGLEEYHEWQQHPENHLGYIP